MQDQKREEDTSGISHRFRTFLSIVIENDLISFSPVKPHFPVLQITIESYGFLSVTDTKTSTRTDTS
jgi:hypothetical protein